MREMLDAKNRTLYTLYDLLSFLNLRNSESPPNCRGVAAAGLTSPSGKTMEK